MSSDVLQQWRSFLESIVPILTAVPAGEEGGDAANDPAQRKEYQDQARAMIAAMPYDGCAAMADFLTPETPSEMLQLLLEECRRRKYPGHHQRALDLLAQPVDEVVHQRAGAYVAALGVDEGELFLRELAGSADKAVAERGRNALLLFKSLSPEKSLIEALRKSNRKSVGPLLAKVRLPRLGRYLADEADGAAIIKVLSTFDAQMAAYVSRTLAPDNPATLLRAALLERELDDPARIAAQAMSLAEPDLLALLREVGPRSAAELLRALLRHAPAWPRALAVISRMPDLVEAVQSDLTVLIAEGDPETQVRAADLLASVPGTVAPVQHADWLHAPDLREEYPGWFQLVVRSQAMAVASRFEELRQGELGERILSLWLEAGQTDPVEAALLQLKPLLEQREPGAQDAWLVLQTVARASLPSAEPLQWLVRCALEQLVEEVDPSRFSEVVALAYRTGEGKLLFTTRLYDRLAPERAEQLLRVAVVLLEQKEQVPSLLRLHRKARELGARESDAHHPAIRLAAMTLQLLKELYRAHSDHATALIGAAADRYTVDLILLVVTDQADLLRGLKAVPASLAIRFVDVLLDDPQRQELALAILEGYPQMIPSLADRLQCLMSRMAPDWQIELVTRLGLGDAGMVPVGHVAFLTDTELVRGRNAWVELVALAHGRQVAERFAQLARPVRRLVAAAWAGAGRSHLLQGVAWQAVAAWMAAGRTLPEGWETLDRLEDLVAGALTDSASMAEPIRALLTVLLPHTSPGQMERITAMLVQVRLTDWAFSPTTVEPLADATARSLLSTLLPQLKARSGVLLLTALLRRAVEEGASRTARLAESLLVDMVSTDPGVLPEALQALRGTRLESVLLDSFTRRFQAITQEVHRLESDLEQARMEERRALAKALAPELEALESFLCEDAVGEANTYRSEVIDQVMLLRKALGAAGIRPVEAGYGLVSFDWALHRAVGPSPEPEQVVSIRSLGLRLEGENDVVRPALVVRRTEEAVP